MDHVVAPVPGRLHVLVLDLAPAVVLVPAPVPELEAKAAAVPDLVVVPRASLVLPGSHVPSQGRAPETIARNHVTSRTIARNLATSQPSAEYAGTVVIEMLRNLDHVPNPPLNRLIVPDPGPNPVASPGTSQDPVHTRDRSRVAGAPAPADRKKATSRWRMGITAAPKLKTATTRLL